MIDGEIVVRDGTVRTVDEATVLADARAMLPDWLRSLEPVDAWAKRLRPYVEEVYRRCAEEDVGFTRWASPSS
jgi:hypothetical protein